MPAKYQAPRIPPLHPDEWTDEQRKSLEPTYNKGRLYNMIGTFTRHPEASKAIGRVSGHILGATSTLSPRDRELLILRTAWLCQAEYEWAQHVLIGRQAGLTDDEITRCQQGSEAKYWTMTEQSLLRAAEQLHTQQKIDDATWAALAQEFDTQQLMDIVIAVGHYTLVACALNSFGTPLDDGLRGF